MRPIPTRFAYLFNSFPVHLHVNDEEDAPQCHTKTASRRSVTWSDESNTTKDANLSEIENNDAQVSQKCTTGVVLLSIPPPDLSKEDLCDTSQDEVPYRRESTMRLPRSSSLRNPYPHLQDLDRIHKLQILIPIFQRKYCWTKAHCMHYWNMEAGRHLGRLLLYHRHNGTLSHPAEHLETIDGQQRMVTCLMLLCSLRDALWRISQGITEEDRRPKIPVSPEMTRYNASRLHDFIMDHLIMDREAVKPYYRTELAYTPEEIKRFTKVVPALDDQHEVFCVLLGRGRDRMDSFIYDAKEQFDELIIQDGRNSVNAIRGLLQTLLFEVNFLHIDMDKDSDVSSVFQSTQIMAQLNKMRFTIPFPGVDVTYFDMVRNLVLSQLPKEELQVQFYHQLWLPLENKLSFNKIEQRNLLDEFLDYYLGEICTNKDARKRDYFYKDMTFQNAHKLAQFMSIATGEKQTIFKEFSEHLKTLLKGNEEKVEMRVSIIQSLLQDMYQKEEEYTKMVIQEMKEQ